MLPQMEAASLDTFGPTETRMDCGWRLAKLSWRLVRSSASMLALGAGLSLFTAAAGAVALALPQAQGGSILALVAIGLLATIIAAFFQVGLVFAADDALDGDRMAASEALGEARERLGAIVAWAAIAIAAQLAFALLLHGLSDRFGLFVSLAALAWSFGTVFVVPMLALQLLAPLEALRESPQLLRRRWGESFAGLFGIGALASLAAIVPGVALSVGVHRNRIADGSGDVAVVLGAVALAIVFVLAATVGAAFAVALYRDGTVGYPQGWAYVERRPRRKSWVLRIVLTIGGLLLALGAVGAILGPSPDAHEFKVSFPASYASVVAPGAPVVYQGHRVGEVKRIEAAGAEEIISFEVESPYESLKGETTIVLSQFEGGPCLLIVPRGQAPPFPERDRGSV